MRRRLRRALGALAFVPAAAGAGCAPRPVPAPAPAPALPEGWHGVVVFFDRGETLPVRFRAGWRRTPAGADTATAFAGAEAGGGWTAYGRLEEGSLVWGLARMAGDAGTTLEMAGAVEPDGRVRGCALPRRGFGPRPAPAAAFALAPLSAPAPVASDAPVERCRGPAR